MSLIEIEPDVRDEAITEPPKKWRNKYLALKTGRSVDLTTGAIREHHKGDCHWGTQVHPSKADAERVAREDCSDPACFPARYLGAFPVDDE